MEREGFSCQCHFSKASRGPWRTQSGVPVQREEEEQRLEPALWLQALLVPRHAHRVSEARGAGVASGALGACGDGAGTGAAAGPGVRDLASFSTLRMCQTFYSALLSLLQKKKKKKIYIHPCPRWLGGRKTFVQLLLSVTEVKPALQFLVRCGFSPKQPRCGTGDSAGTWGDAEGHKLAALPASLWAGQTQRAEANGNRVPFIHQARDR